MIIYKSPTISNIKLWKDPPCYQWVNPPTPNHFMDGIWRDKPQIYPLVFVDLRSARVTKQLLRWWGNSSPFFKGYLVGRESRWVMMGLGNPRSCENFPGSTGQSPLLKWSYVLAARFDCCLWHHPKNQSPLPLPKALWLAQSRQLFKDGFQKTRPNLANSPWK